MTTTTTAATEEEEEKKVLDFSVLEKRPALYKEYTVHMTNDGDHTFAIEIIDDTSPCFGWVFKINKIIVPEAMSDEELEETKDITISIDYSVVHPEKIDLDLFPGGEEDEQIMNSIGPCVIAFIEEAVRQSALSIEEKEAEKTAAVHEVMAEEEEEQSKEPENRS